VRDVGEQSSQRDDELDAERLGEVDDLAAEAAPAEIGLDAEAKDGVSLGSRQRGVVEDRLRPVDLPRQPPFEGDVRADGLEVEELLRVEIGEAARLPGLGEIARRERGSLRPVVPPPEGSDQ
jgi:hypothetical protein